LKNPDSLRIPLPTDEELQKRFGGSYIAIQDGNIIAIDQTLRGLHEKCKSIDSSGKGCHIEYIEEGASIYGASF